MRSHIDHRTVRPAAQASPRGAEGAAEERPKRPHGTDWARGDGKPADIAALGPLAGMIGYALRRAQLAVFDDAIRAIADLDLRLAQFSVLALVGHRPGLKQSEVAAALGIQRANFVAVLDSLEKRGLARRAPSPHDRRCHALHLTAEGERTLARANSRLAASEARLDANLGPDGRARLLEMLWRLALDRDTAERV